MPNDTVGDLGAWYGGQPLVHRPALIGLDVPERDPPQALQRYDPSRRRRYRREQAALTAMEEKRLVGDDKELIEGEPAGAAISGTNVDRR